MTDIVEKFSDIINGIKSLFDTILSIFPSEITTLLEIAIIIVIAMYIYKLIR